jgi:hypothetical protein
MKIKQITNAALIFSLLNFSILFALKSDVLEETFRKAIPANGLNSILVINPHGDVGISGKTSGDIEIKAKKIVYYRDRDNAEEIMSQIKISFEKRAGKLHLKSIFPELHNRDRKFYRRVIGYKVQFDVIIPAKFFVEIENRYGDVSVVGVKSLFSENRNGESYIEYIDGETNLNNTYGNITVSFIEGDLTCENRNGKIKIKDVAGICDVKNSYGNVTVSKIKDNITIVNKNGKVDVRSINGDVDISNSYGSILVEDVKKDLKVYNKNGAVEALDIGKSADITTSYNRIQCINIGGKLKAKNRNGSVTVETVNGRVDIETSYNFIKGKDISGPVTILNKNGLVYLDNVKGNVDLESSYNTIEIFNINGSAEIVNRNGKIIGEAITGSVNANTSYNSVRFDNIAGKIYVMNKSGKISVSGNPQSIDVSTSYDRINLSDVECPSVIALTRNGSIDADIKLPSNGNCRLETSYGDINLTVPGNTSSNITATVPKGNRIRVLRGLTMTTTELKKEKLSGKLGRGNGSIELFIEKSGNINLSAK